MLHPRLIEWDEYRESIPAFEQEVGETEPLAIPDFIDWCGTGRGIHVDLKPDENLPIQMGRLLGRGATSDVYEATVQGLAVAVKQRYLSRRNRCFPALEKELRNLQQVTAHLHVVKIIGSFIQNRTIGILLWPVAICDLGTFLEDVDGLWQSFLRDGSDGHLGRDKILSANESEAFERLQALKALKCHEFGNCTFFPAYLRLERLFGCLAGALTYLHGQKIKHKDLKPSNILLTPTNMYLSDFGTSTDFSEITASATDSGDRGTPKYFAPEVANWLPNGRSSDIFSLGCIFLEIAYVQFGEPLETLKRLRPNRDRSFQANLHMAESWLLPFRDSDPLGGPFSILLSGMLEERPEGRPSASDIVWRLHAMRRHFNLEGRIRDAYFDRCCAGTVDDSIDEGLVLPEQFTTAGTSKSLGINLHCQNESPCLKWATV